MRRDRIRTGNVHSLNAPLSLPDGIDDFDCLPHRVEDSGLKTKLEERLAEFNETYEKARELIGRKSKLVYRIDLTTEDLPVDNIYASKIGGVPDLCATESIGRYREESTGQFNFPTADQFVADNWPRCQICLRPMRFLAQINIWDWILVIHQLTGQKKKQRIRPGWEEWHSAMGYSYPLVKYGASELANKHLMIWHCSSSCSHGLHFRAQCQWSHNGLSAAYRRKLINKGAPIMQTSVPKQAVDMFGENYPWTIADYQRAVNRFIEGETKLQTYSLENEKGRLRFSRTIKHGTGCFPISIKPRVIVNAKIGFDPTDIPNYEAPNDPIFRSHGDFVLFGCGRSQQEPINPLCPNSYTGPHQMAPVIAYDEPGEDLTHQIYSCLTCGSGPYDGYDSPFPGILDSSCT